MRYKNITGICPVTNETLVQCYFKDVSVNSQINEAGGFIWSLSGSPADIIEFEPLGKDEKPLNYHDIPWTKKPNLDFDRIDKVLHEPTCDELASEYKPEGTNVPTTAQDFLTQAKELIDKRGVQYDQKDGERSANKIAKAFNAITGQNLTASEIWLILLLLKQVRQWTTKSYHNDSSEDSVAYAALLSEQLIDEKKNNINF